MPLYTLARELDKRGYGDYRLQSYTPTGTPSLRGLVSVMAGLTVEETDKGGLKLRRFRHFPRGAISFGAGAPVQCDPALEGILPPQTAALASESTGAAVGQAVME